MENNNNDLKNDHSILSSLLYLRSELLKAGYFSAEMYVERACESFIEQISKKQTHVNDFIKTQAFIKLAKESNPAALESFISWVEKRDPKNDNMNLETY